MCTLFCVLPDVTTSLAMHTLNPFKSMFGLSTRKWQIDAVTVILHCMTAAIKVVMAAPPSK